ncbi:MAG: RluA family pseudouridine synthase [Phycisphaerales bacterium]
MTHAFSHRREPHADDEAWSSGILLPGGKVDADAIVAAQQKARELGLAEEDDAELRRVRFELRHDLNKRLDKYLVDRITFLSRTQLQRLIDEGGVLVNGKPPKNSTKLNAGDVVEVVVPAPANKDIQPEDIPLEVMYEDDHIIVINKSPDIIVHPARSENKGTMLGALAYHFKFRTSGGLSAVGKDFARPGVVHRLDRNTSGVIVFAKTDEAHWKLGHQFEHRNVDKRYLALAHGLVEPDTQVIDLPIGPHPSREKGYREKYVVRHDELGKPSVTIVRVRERYVLQSDEVVKALGTGHQALAKLPVHPTPSASAQSPVPSASSWRLPELPKNVSVSTAPTNLFEAEMQRFSLVELELKTGRTHQIRVHLSHNLWPIVGDDMYGGKALSSEMFVQAKSRGAQAPGGRSRTSKKTPATSENPPGACAPRLLIGRQALHATILAFDHPITGTPLRFVAPLRGDMAETIAALRKASKGGELVDAPGATVDLKTVASASSR